MEAGIPETTSKGRLINGDLNYKKNESRQVW